MPRRWLAGAAGGLLLVMAPSGAGALPITPTHDDEIVERLPTSSAARAEERRLRQRLRAQPANAALALEAARRHLEQAHAQGDPRHAGLAMAALQPWSDPATAPGPVLLMRATLQQYLHAFDASAATLQTLLSRPAEQRNAQAWLSLATVQRVRGRYAESDVACDGVARSGAELHAAACRAENLALRGETATARRNLIRWAAAPAIDNATRGWLQTTIAELEQRDGRAAQADAAFRLALAASSDDYTLIAYADFLVDQRRPREALALLKDRPPSDAVVLRRAVATASPVGPAVQTDALEMRARIEQANQRPDARLAHGREQAMFALRVERQPALALELARGNVSQQREPIDLLILAQAARASGDAAALDEVRRLKRTIGLHDRRIDALL